jgi:2-desacetyl-2-hydroxyethyl bacteriochlorophyllide A dehydrogenase
MIGRVKTLALSGVDAILGRQGFAGTDLKLARESVRSWARARLALTAWRGSVAGLAVVISRPGRAELIPVDVRLPAPGQLMIEVLVSAISPGTERAQWLRQPNAQPALPFRPGYSGAGRVLSVGRGVRGFAKGDLVAVSRIPHASVLTIPATRAVQIPVGVPIEQAALVYLAMISGYGLRRSEMAAGDRVCVIGSGPIGALAARLARAAGAGSLTIIAKSARHRHSATLAGADFRLIEGRLEGIDAPVVIDATGDPNSVSAAFEAVSNEGTIVLLGSPRGVSNAVPIAQLQERRLRLVGAHISALAIEAKRGGGDPLRELASQFLEGLAKGAITAADLAGEAIDPREVSLMYRRLAEGSLGSAHLDWTRIPREQRVVERGAFSMPPIPKIGGLVKSDPAEPLAMQKRPLRFAAIGCGDIGLSNARAIACSRNAELALVYDSVSALAEAAAARHGGAIASSLSEAFDKERIDAVFLSVPHDLHAPMINEAAAAGVHIVVEKPLAVDLDSAVSSVRAAGSAGVTLSVCFPYRYESAPAAALKLVEAGALGTFRGATIVFHADKPQSYWQGGFSSRANSPWRTSAERSGGGVMIMNLTHFVDLLRHISGCEAIEVSAFARVPPDAEVEDEIAASVRFENGAVATILGSASTRGAPGTRVDIWGENGTLQLEPEARIYTERAVPGLLTSRWNTLPTDNRDVRTLFVERFCAAVLDQQEPDITARDGLAVQAFVEAVYRSVRSGRPEPITHVASVR